MTADVFTETTLKTIQSQYSASPALVALIQSFSERLNPHADIDLFYEKYFNPATAEGIGLDYWGRIVGVGRHIDISDVDFFGFYGQELQPFNQEPFHHSFTGEGISSLSDEAYRWLIFYKAMVNISDSSMKSTNDLLLRLMRMLRPNAKCYVQEVSAMHVSIVFLFELTTLERAIFELYGLLNIGAGVQISISQSIPDNVVVPQEGVVGTGCGAETIYGLVSSNASKYWVSPNDGAFGTGGYDLLIVTDGGSDPFGNSSYKVYTSDTSITKIDDIDLVWYDADYMCISAPCSQELTQAEYNALRNADAWVINRKEENDE